MPSERLDVTVTMTRLYIDNKKTLQMQTKIDKNKVLYDGLRLPQLKMKRRQTESRIATPLANVILPIFC